MQQGDTQKSADLLKSELTKLSSSIQPFLYHHYVQEFLASSDLGTDEKEIKASIRSQQAQLIRLDKELRQEHSVMKKEAFASIEKLYSSELIFYRDIAKKAEELLNTKFEHLLPKESRLTNEVVLEIHQVIKTFFLNQKQAIEALVELGKKRSEKLKEIEQFQKRFLKMTSCLASFKDLHSFKQQLEERCQKMNVLRYEFQKASFEEVEELVSARYLQFQEFFRQVPQICEEIHQKTKQLEFRCQDGKQTIQCRLFEIFFGISPYQDLLEIFSNLRQALAKKLKTLIDGFYQGTLKIDDFLVECQEMAYDHDVVKIRNELSHRSARLKDIRDEILHLNKQIAYFRRFLQLAGLIQEKCYRELVLYGQQVDQIIQEVENPFKAFAKAYSKDDINYVFRAFWMRIEELQPKIERAIEEAHRLLHEHVEVIKKAFFKTVDDIETVCAKFEGKRPVLLGQIERDFQYASFGTVWQMIEEQIQRLEKRYPFVQPLSFYMRIKDFQECQEALLNAKMLDDSIKNTHDFAKTMQYIKTFEEERIDAILEGFEHLYMLEDTKQTDQSLKEVFTKYFNRMRLSREIVEQEVFADIGLLDKHALMDVDQLSLEKVLALAFQRATAYVDEHLETIREMKFSQPLHQRLQQMILSNLITWKKVDERQDFLEKLRLFCHDLFDMKTLLASAHEKSALAKSLAIIADLRFLCLEVQEWLQEERKAKNPAWGKPWITELHEIGHLIERFELVADGKNELASLIKKVFSMIMQIPEIGQMQTDPFSLEARQGELKNHVKEYEALAEDVALPFVYLPGFMVFFCKQKEKR